MHKDNISEDKHFINIFLLIADKDIKFHANQLIAHYSLSNNNKETKRCPFCLERDKFIRG